MCPFTIVKWRGIKAEWKIIAEGVITEWKGYKFVAANSSFVNFFKLECISLFFSYYKRLIPFKERSEKKWKSKDYNNYNKN